MTKFRLSTILSSLIIASFVLVSHTHADDIKSRMLARLPIIKELKAKGMIGENNKGYLEFVGSNVQKKDVVDAENNDRKEVYANIAKKLGTTADLVGKHRAKDNAKKAEPDEWVQDETGEWHQKK